MLPSNSFVIFPYLSAGHITMEEHNYFIAGDQDPLKPCCVISTLLQRALQTGILGDLISSICDGILMDCYWKTNDNN